MGKRIYNILFHLHTVSGIVISAALYVIFFAGSFSFFRDEIVNWERDHTVQHPGEISLDLDATIDSLKLTHDLYGREISIAQVYNERRVNVNVGASADSLASEEAKKPEFFYLDTKSFDRQEYYSSYTLGEFLYRLHFFAQIPYPAGYYLSGFVAFFFLFALITGLIVHWDKIIKNFYLFRPWEKLKTVWTDAHTTLGLIGFPFQLVYAVTGAFFMLNLLLVAPSVYVLYDGDSDKLYDELGFKHPAFPLQYEKLEKEVSINKFISQTKTRWKSLNVSHVIIHNYGDKNMHVTVEGRADHSEKFLGVGEVSYHAETGDIVNLKDEINESSYLEGTKLALYQLHFADYGGLWIRIVSFVLGLVSCFVILSGVLIWLVARDRKDVPEKQKRFNQRVAWIYLAICLSMYPVTAFAFIVVKMFGIVGSANMYSLYFITWLLVTVFFVVKKSNSFTNRYSLISGSILGFLVPVANGIKTSNWPWITFVNQQYDILLVDLLWIGLSSCTLYAVYCMSSYKQTKVAA
ncbi:PepSY-associated TM helix domain-containing protein [Reichenbachiella sp. MALMAid0571]|uniref:PepSY-associated TM helix domain-containing protein n=1 Tax=Reichenbachiella sp. MALMAid0571 TaxID=3143939 RepID=UPI0032DEE11C